jgi:hypothetical protein
MVVFERTMGGVLRYFKVFLPTEDQLARLASNMRPLDVLRVFAGPPAIVHGFSPIAQGWAQTTVVDLSKGQEAIYAAMHTNCRYKVRRAEKMHDRFEVAMNTPAACADFLALYNAFASSRGKMPALKPGRFNAYLPHADVFVLYFEGLPTCGRLVLRDEQSGTALMLYSGTRRFEQGTDTITVGLMNRYLHWHEMKTYQAAGLATYDFGGVGPGRAVVPSVSNFKMSFGGRLIPLGLYLYAGAARPAWKFAHSVYVKWRGESLLYTPAAAGDTQNKGEPLLGRSASGTSLLDRPSPGE